MELAVIIPVHNRKAYIEKLLAQLHQQKLALDENLSLQLIVVDDGSTDGTDYLIQSLFPEVCLIRGDGNLWWTGGIVRGMTYAIEHFQPDYFLWLNDDISLDDDFLHHLSLVCVRPQSSQQLIGGIVRDATYSNWIVYSGQQRGTPLRSFEAFAESAYISVDTVAGNITLVPKQVVDVVGLPDNNRFPHHGGDYTYAKRIKRAGFEIKLTRILQASTDYQLSDLIRYMPYWMQWRVSPGFKNRIAILKGLSSLKANQNIWLFVNLQRQDQTIFPWAYFFCYINKLIKLFLVSFMPRDLFLKRLRDYLEEWHTPSALWSENSSFDF